MSRLVARLEDVLNGIDVDALDAYLRAVEQDPAEGMVEFRVVSSWAGQTRSRTNVESCSLGGRRIDRHFVIDTDLPAEMLGTDQAPNPQELLLAAFNACLVGSYVLGATLRGVRLRDLHIATRGAIDLRGYLGICENVRPGFESLHFVTRLNGEGTREQLRDIHDAVIRTSANYFNIARPIRIDGDLIIER